MAMKLVREGKKTEYKQENGQIITDASYGVRFRRINATRQN